MSLPRSNTSIVHQNPNTVIANILNLYLIHKYKLRFHQFFNEPAVQNPYDDFFSRCLSLQYLIKPKDTEAEKKTKKEAIARNDAAATIVAHNALKQAEIDAVAVNQQLKVALYSISEEFASCSSLIAIDVSDFPDLIKATENLIAETEKELLDQELSETDKERLKVLNAALIKLRQQISAAIKIYLDHKKKNPNSNYPSLTNLLIEKTNAAFAPLTKEASILQVNGEEKQKVVEHLIWGQVPNDFNKKNNNEDHHAVLPDANCQDILLQYVFQYGTESDKEELLLGGYVPPSYFQQFLKEAYQGIGKVYQGVLSIPQEIRDQIIRLKMSKDLDRNSYERAKQKILNRLAVYDQQKRRGKDLSRIILQEMPEEEFVSADQTIEQRLNVQQPVEVTHNKGKTKEKADELNHFTEVFAELASIQAQNLLVFHTDNLEIVRALSRKLDDPQSYIYTKQEIEKLRIARDTNEKIKKEGQIEAGELFKLRDAVVIKHHHNIRLSFANRLTLYPENQSEELTKSNSDLNEAIRKLVDEPQKEENIFDELMQLNSGHQEKIEYIIRASWNWNKIQDLAILSADKLSEMAQDIDHLEDYIKLMKQELRLDDLSPSAHEYRKKKGLSIETFAGIYQNIENLKKLIRQRREQLVDVMLARLSLLPKERLDPRDVVQESDNDLVLSMAEGLTQVGLSKDFVERLKTQTKTQTITKQQIGEFSSYITDHGTQVQLEAQLSMFQTEEASVETSQQRTDIFMPTRIPRHYRLVENEEVPLVSSHDGKTSNLNWSFMYLDGSINLTESQNLKESKLTDSFIFMNSSTSVQGYIPSGKMIEVNSENAEEVMALYEGVGAHQFEEQEDDFDFEYVFNAQEKEQFNGRAKVLFATQANQNYFIEKARYHLLVDEQDEENKDNKNISVDKKAYDETAKNLIELEADVLFANLNMEDRKTQFIKIANQLANHFYELKDKSDKKFEAYVLDYTFKAMIEIEKHAKKLQEEMRDAEFDVPEIQNNTAIFKTQAYLYFERYHKAPSMRRKASLNEEELAGLRPAEQPKASIVEAELDMLIAIHGFPIDEKHRTEFKKAVKDRIPKINNCFDDDQALWLQKIKEEKERMMAAMRPCIEMRTKLMTFFRSEQNRINNQNRIFKFFKLERRTRDKSEAITNVISIISKESEYDKLKEYAKGLESKDDYKNLHAKRGLFSFLIPCAKSTLSKRLHKLNKSIVPPQKPK